MSLLNRIVSKIARALEEAAARVQGKGYGAASIAQENEMTHRLLKREPKLAIDVGGNIGEYAAELRRRNSAIEIHIFEPSDTNVKKLKRRFVNDELITVVPFAISDHAGSATLFSDAPGSGLGSLTKRRLDHFNIDFDAQQSVATIRFEDYWKNTLQSRPLDIVKIDIEGHELAALNGFGSALDAVSVLQFEFGGCNIDTRTFFQDFWYFFQAKGFDIYRITPTGVQFIEEYREADEFFSTTNYIALKRGNY